QDKCIHELFEEQVSNHPDAIALVYEEEQLSYAELNTKANQLAHYLVREKGVTPDTLVGICMDRSLAMVVAILGILKAGAAYVPLDPDYPAARLAYLLDDAQLDTVITHNQVRGRIPFSETQTLCLDEPEVQAQLSALASSNLPTALLNLNSRHLAYVIYTSGSTGKPKGVMVEHRSVANLAGNLEQLDLCKQGQRWGWLASYAFDASVQALSQLMLGRSLLLISDQCKRDPVLLAPLLDSLSVMDCTPMMVEVWFAAGLADRLPHLLIGGEAISQKMWDQLVGWQAQYSKKAVNVYGPTECTVDSTACVIEGRLPNIGKILNNGKAYVLNSYAGLAPQGIAGELYIGGVGVARGYLSRPELTTEKFVCDPFCDGADADRGERLYRTGDLVRWLPDGKLEFLGRIDQQVKIRGFRIELGEIEHTLRQHGKINDAVVITKETAAGEQALVAYIVSNEGKDGNEGSDDGEEGLIASLRLHLSLTLPDYMVPAAFMRLDKLPLTTNGKLDRKALPEPDLSRSKKDYIAPSSETEHALCRIWQEVLGLERVGVTDNFFELGGHSLLSMKILAVIRAEFHIDIPVRAIFSDPTIAAIAIYIDALTMNNSNSPHMSADDIEEGMF
ncbi:MAG: amino acid adenylation domain-containing protein, partial [Undibacterium sp.]|nr:amino acid adenylation domain-containing protein [Undibacterium sp.]